MHHLVHRISSSVIRSAPANYVGRHGMITFQNNAFYIHDGRTPGGIAVTGVAAGFATEDFVGTAIDNLINGAPGALDTLNELSAALGNDPDYAATIVNALALKADKTSLNTHITNTTNALALKADQVDLDTHITNTTNALALKADQTSLNTHITNTTNALALKADQTSLNTHITNTINALALKADQSDLNSFILNTNSELALKADQTSLDAYIASNDAAVALKSDQTSLDAYIASNNAAVALKANQTSFDNFILDTNTALALKADQSSLNTHITNTANALALKANASDVYTKTESNNNFLDVAGDSMTGRLVLSSGAAGGLAFPDNAFGGGADTATITLVTAGGEDTRMTFTMTNDAGDKFNFVAPSNNGLLMNDNVVWHAGNDGSGSGLDADLLDGINSASFLRGDVPNAPGMLSFSGTAKFGLDDAGIDCYLEITDANPVYQGTQYGSEINFYGDKSINSSLLTFGGAKAKHGLWVDDNKVWHAGNDGPGSGLAADTAADSSLLSGWSLNQILPYQSTRDFTVGTLIQTDIDYSVTAGEPWLLEIEGNSYGSQVPFDIKYQGYIYTDTIINHGGISNGTTVTGMSAFLYNGKLCFWFPRQTYWQGFTVRVNSSYDGPIKNRLVSITDQAKPVSISKEVELSSHIRQSLHTGNYNNYAPTLTGTGASGTWGIDISGTANTASAVSLTNEESSSGTHYLAFVDATTGNKSIKTDSGITFVPYTNTLSTSIINASHVTISGTLTVNGTLTTINTTTLEIEDANIVIAKGATSAAAANNAGLTINGANATMTYASSGDKFVFNKSVDSQGYTVNGNTVWHAGNDGAGTGLDADLLDGNQSSAFILKTELSGLKGQVPYVSADNTAPSTMDWVLKTGKFVSSDAELSAQQSIAIDYTAIFNTWTRFSHNTSGSQPASASELNAWTIDSVTGKISCTQNTSTYVGFISPEKYSDYQMEVRLTSTNVDNDNISVIVGWYVDPSTGRQYTLSALRDTGGWRAGWQIVYNYNRSDETVIADGNSLVTRTGNWSDYNPNGTKIKVIRSGNQFTFVTTQMGVDSYDVATTLTVDLNSNPILSKFAGSSNYGFGALSQNQASFETLLFTGSSNSIYDIRNGKKYVITNGVWTEQVGGSLFADFGVGRFLHNEDTDKTYFIKDTSTAIPVAGAYDQSLNTTNSVTFANVTSNILKIEDGVQEKVQALTGSTGTVTHDCSSGQVFYHTTPAANFTANFTNLNLAAGYATTVSLIITQGATAYIPNAVQIGGVAQVINWQGNSVPTGTTNRTDVVTFSIVNNSGTYVVLGQLVGF